MNYIKTFLFIGILMIDSLFPLVEIESDLLNNYKVDLNKIGA
jgi:hypothetical protein